ncbi:MAG: TetR/AcrR family transcriptional regulator [Spirochaetes bacterium]|nr:MAG: TetR/AcrR family transcriptional regulator [Spirochaetota bacterium]
MAPVKNTSVKEERKEWARAQRQERIIGMAAQLLAKCDIEEITLEDVAKSSGYTIQNLYQYFKNKDDLFAAVLLKKLKVMYADAESAVERTTLGIDRIITLGDKYVDFCLRNKRYFDLQMHFERKFCAYHKLTAKKTRGDFIVQCQGVIDQVSDLAIDAIKSGIEDRSIKTHLKPLHLMLLLWAQMLGVIQVITMRQRYFKEIYELTSEKFRRDFKDSIQAYLSSGQGK